MKQDPKIAKEVMHDLIRAAERRINFTLNIEDFDFLSYALVQFVHQAIDKFVDGAARHYNENDHSFVDSVPHLVENRKEIIDSWMYTLAEQKLKQKK